jgi:hypothetical protein
MMARAAVVIWRQLVELGSDEELERERMSMVKARQSLNARGEMDLSAVVGLILV